MGLQETEGIVLKNYNLSEADKIVVFLTKEQGLVRGVAKGAKRLKSRFGSSLESFSFVNLVYYQKDDRELVSIREIELVKSSFENTSNPDLFEKFAYISELITEFAPPHDPNEKLYRMVKVCTETFDHKETGLVNHLILYFEIWLLRLAGYMPDLNICSSCRRVFAENESGSLQYDFQVLCQTCDPGKRREILSANERSLLNLSQKKDPKNFIRLTENYPESVFSLSNKLKKLITGIVGKKLTFERLRTDGT